MNKMTCAAMAMVLGLMSTAAMAQNAGGQEPPPPANQGEEMNRPDDRHGQGGGPGQEMRGSGEMRGQGQGQRGPGGGMPRPNPLDAQRVYLDVVERFGKLANDPEASAVAAVISANELMRPKGDDATIAYFETLLTQAKNPAVKRAIRLHLIDLYRKTQKSDKALAQVEQLIKEAPEK